MKITRLLCSIPLALALLMGSMVQAQTNTFDIDIFQNNRKLKVEDNEVKLERAPFYFRIHLKENVKGVFVQASFDNDLYRLRKRQSIPGFAYIPSKVMAEDAFNVSKEIIFRNDASWHLWFYKEGQSEHNFDRNSILLNGEKTLAYKTIEGFYLYDEESGGYSASVYSCNPDVYLLFMTASIDEDNWELVQELDRLKLKLVWQ